MGLHCSLEPQPLSWCREFSWTFHLIPVYLDPLGPGFQNLGALSHHYTHGSKGRGRSEVLVIKVLV